MKPYKIMTNCGDEVLSILRKYSIIVIPTAFEHGEPLLNEYVRRYAPSEIFSKVRSIPCYSEHMPTNNDGQEKELNHSQDLFRQALDEIECEPDDTVAVVILLENYHPSAALLGAKFFIAAAESALFPDMFIY
ncbi:hypothetical protein HY620_00405 [Candidatus Uhrbacteria bacterium]|nr:hypothetical protein [Candidatus Uhrbacteria bacterium]